MQVYSSVVTFSTWMAVGLLKECCTEQKMCGACWKVECSQWLSIQDPVILGVRSHFFLKLCLNYDNLPYANITLYPSVPIAYLLPSVNCQLAYVLSSHYAEKKNPAVTFGQQGSIFQASIYLFKLFISLPDILIQDNWKMLSNTHIIHVKKYLPLKGLLHSRSFFFSCKKFSFLFFFVFLLYNNTF